MKKALLVILALLMTVTLLASCGDNEAVSYKVSFDYATGDAPITVTVYEGDTVSKPADPKREGYAFTGWTLGGIPYDFATPVTDDITLIAGWKETKSYSTITYYYYDGYSYDGYHETASVENGTPFLNKECDVYASIEFDGWYSADGKLYDESVTVTEDITVYATVLSKGLMIEEGVVIGLNADPAEIIIPKYYRSQPVCEIADEALMGKSASKISLPDTLTKIGTRAFYNCKALTEIYVPDSVTSVGFAAFGTDMRVIPLGEEYNAYLMDQGALKSISLPTIYGDEAKYLCYIFGAPSPEANDYSLEGIKLTHNAEEVTVNMIQYIPISLLSVTVRGDVEIPDYAFADCYYLTGISYGSKVERIGEYAFDGCTSAMISGVFDAEYIGYGAFRSCPIRDISFPSVKEIGPYAFASTSITSFTFPEGLTSIGSGAFALTGISEVTFPESLESLGAMAFYGCNELDAVYFTSASAPSVGDAPFTTLDEEGVLYYSTASIWVPDGSLFDYRDAVYLRDYASRIFPVSKLGESGFVCDGTVLLGFIGDEALETLTVPQGITEIAPYAFYGDPSVNEIILPEGFTKIGKYAFYNCIYVNMLSMPSTMKEIDDYAFAGFFVGNELTRLYFPEGFERIGDGAFLSSFNLKIIDLPSTIKYIGYLSFGMSNYLEAMYVRATVPPTVGTYDNGSEGIACDIFSIVNSAKTVIYVPNGETDGTKIADTYRTAPGFSNFAGYIKPMATGKEVGHYGNGTLFVDLDGAGTVTVYEIVESENNTADFAGAKYEYVKKYGSYTLTGTTLKITLDGEEITAIFANREMLITYGGKSHALTEPKSYYDSYNWTNFKLYPSSDTEGAGVFDMYGSFLTPFTYVIEGGVFKMSVDGNNTAPGHEDYFGIKEYTGTYDAESDKFSIAFMLNDYEELMQFNADRIYPVYATAAEMKLYGTYICYGDNGYEMFTIVSYANGKCDLYIGDQPYLNLDYTANGNKITVMIFGMPQILTIHADGTITATGQIFTPSVSFTYVDEVRDPTKLPSRDDV